MIMDVITKCCYSGLSILLHGIISRPDATSCDKVQPYVYFKCESILHKLNV